MKRLILLLVVLALVAPAAAQTTTTRTDRVIASTSIVIGGTSFTPSAATLGGTLAVTGAATLNGAVTLGDASGDAITFSGRVSSSILWTTDNSVDLGASGANRPRDFFLGRNAAIGGTLGVTGNTTLTGDLAINGNDLTSTGALTVRPSGHLTLDPTGDILLGPDGLDIMPAAAYTYNLGALTNKYLTLHAAELWVETLVAQNTLATIGGRILVGPTTTLTADLAAAATTMSVKHNSLANGDRVYLEANGAVEFIAVASVASGSGPYTYTISRNLDGSGANDWAAGDAVFNTGTTGSGWIDLYSIRGVKSASETGPTIVGNVRTSSTYNAWSPRWAIGDLNGLYGYGATTYGAAFGDASATNVTVDATNGFRVRAGTTNIAAWDTSGVLRMYDAGGVQRVTLNAASGLVLGSTTAGETYAQVSNDELQFCLAGTSCNFIYTAATGVITIGYTGAEHVSISGSILEFKNGSTVLGSLDGTTLTLGQPLTSNNTGQLLIDSDSVDVRWRDNSGSTTTVFQIANDGGTASLYGTGNLTVTGYIRTGSSISNASGDLTVMSEAIGGDVILSATGATRPDSDANRSLGENGKRWGKFFLGPTTTTATFNPLVLGTSGEVWEKTDGVSATFNPTTCTSMTFEGGILTAKAGC